MAHVNFGLEIVLEFFFEILTTGTGSICW